jgi:hypothetical protein
MFKQLVDPSKTKAVQLRLTPEAHVTFKVAAAKGSHVDERIYRSMASIAEIHAEVLKEMN